MPPVEANSETILPARLGADDSHADLGTGERLGGCRPVSRERPATDRKGGIRSQGPGSPADSGAGETGWVAAAESRAMEEVRRACFASASCTFASRSASAFRCPKSHACVAPLPGSLCWSQEGGRGGGRRTSQGHRPVGTGEERTMREGASSVATEGVRWTRKGGSPVGPEGVGGAWVTLYQVAVWSLGYCVLLLVACMVLLVAAG